MNQRDFKSLIASVVMRANLGISRRADGNAPPSGGSFPPVLEDARNTPSETPSTIMEEYLSKDAKLKTAVEWTPRALERAQNQWSFYAGEPIEVENIGGTIYAFGSELAVLRLYRRFQGKGEAKFSTNLKKWYFSPR